MYFTDYFERPWVFKGRLLIPHGTQVSIKSARFNLFEGKFEAQEICDCVSDIIFFADSPRELYVLPFEATNIIATISNVNINSSETGFTLKPVSSNPGSQSDSSF